MTRNETDNFEAFDLVASALEELELYEASVKAREAEKEKYSRTSASDKGRDFAATSGQGALVKARGYLNDALNGTQKASSKDDEESGRKEKKPRGDKEYFKAYYLLAMTDYFSKNPSGAVTQFNHILNSTDGETSASRAANKARETADNAFVGEVRYNLGAAQLEAGKTSEAITNFGIVLADSEKDSLLQLSARLGMALAGAKASSSKRPEAIKEIRKIRLLLQKDAIFLFRIGWRGGLIIKKRKIDQQTADSFRLVLARVRKELDSKESQTVAPSG